jgi:hypothetical protein
MPLTHSEYLPPLLSLTRTVFEPSTFETGMCGRLIYEAINVSIDFQAKLPHRLARSYPRVQDEDFVTATGSFQCLLNEKTAPEPVVRVPFLGVTIPKYGDTGLVRLSVPFTLLPRFIDLQTGILQCQRSCCVLQRNRI